MLVVGKSREVAGRQAAAPPGAPASWHFGIPGSQAGKVGSGIPSGRTGPRALKTPHPQTPTPPLGSLSSLLLLYFRASLLGKRRPESHLVHSWPIFLVIITSPHLKLARPTARTREKYVHLPIWCLSSSRLRHAHSADCAVSLPRAGPVSPGQPQLQPHHGEPSALHAPSRVFN